MVTLTNGDDASFQPDTNDEVFALAGHDLVAGGGGNDTIWGGSGNDILNGGTGLDVLNGGTGIDTVFYSFASSGVFASLGLGFGYVTGLGKAADEDKLVDIENLTGSNYDDTLAGDDDNNVLKGLKGGDRLNGWIGNDTLEGGEGYDRLEGWDGADHLDGGAGFDYAAYKYSTAGVQVDLLAGTGALGQAEGDTLVNIEGVDGSDFADVLRGDANYNSLLGGKGADTLSGRGGSDDLYGHEGKDILNGGGGDDVLSGGKGADTLNGGTGFDTANYYLAGAAIGVNLASGGTAGEAAGDVYNAIETVWGSAHGDTITGDGNANTLVGYGGNDTMAGGGGADRLLGREDNDVLKGGAGADTIEGGASADTMTGGAGADVFYYNALPDSGTTAATRDVITDFQHGIDKIDLSDIGGKTYVGFSFSSIPGQVRQFYEGGNTVIQLDTTGLKTAAMEITLQGQIILSADDFIFA
jgi:Ca2+-binding RTX toxin-like protein